MGSIPSQRTEAGTDQSGAGGQTPSSPRGVKAVFQKVRPPRSAPTPALDKIIKEIRSRRPKADIKQVERAFEMADAAHAGQLRKSGDPFISHPLNVAQLLAELGLDEAAVSAALLHDAVEDTPLTLAEVEEEMGYDIASLIDGVTKLDKIRFRTAEQSRAENLRKMMVATARDVRVLLIKIADRLHNMRTIAPLRPEKRELIARETLEIYAPLAHRLGMYAIKWELEDLSFAALHPKRFQEIEGLIQQRQPERERLLDEVRQEISVQVARRQDQGRGIRSSEEPLLDLREDRSARETVRSDLRSGRSSGRGRQRPRLLRGTRSAPHGLHAGAGALQGLHRDAQVQHVPVVAHDGDRATRPPPRDPDPDDRDA